MDVKAHVLESAEGEISCSVEETNRIRAMLGMRPLDLGPSKAERAVVDVRVDKEKAAAEDDARRRIERARKEREASGHSASAPRGLGDVLPEKKMSAAQWVALSRTAPAAAAAQPPVRKPHGGAGAIGSEIAGARIAHGADEFEPGEEGAILTLKDSGLLDVSGKGLAGEGAGGGADELYSEDLLAREKAADRAERKRRATQPAYSGVDDEEFSGAAGGVGGAGGGAAAAAAARQKALLFQYDEEDVYDPRGSAAASAAARTAAKGLVIGSNGAVTDVAAADRVRARLAAASGPQAIDISSAGLGALLGHPAASAAEAATRTGSDYRTAREEEAERAAAAAAAARARQARKKKRLRGREAEQDGDGEESGALAAGGVQQAALPQQQQLPSAQQSIAAEITGHVTDARDRGSRAARRGVQIGAEGAGGPSAAGDAAATAHLQAQLHAQLHAAGAAGVGAGAGHLGPQPTYVPGAIVPDDVAFAPSTAAAGASRGSGGGTGAASSAASGGSGHGAVGSGGAVDVASLSRQQREELSAFQQRGRAYDAAQAKAAARTQQAFGRGGEASGDADAAGAGAAAGGAEGEAEEAVAAPASSFLLPAASAGISSAGDGAVSGYSAVSRQRIYSRLRPGVGGSAAERDGAGDGGRGRDEGEEEEDDAELAAMLAKARRMAQRAEAPSAAAAAAASGTGAAGSSAAAAARQSATAGGAGGAGAGSVKQEDAGARAILEQLAFRGRGGHAGSTNGAASVIKPDVSAGAAASATGAAANGGAAGAFPGVLRAQVMDVEGQPSSPAAGGSEGGGGFGADVDADGEEGGSGSGGLVFTDTTEFASLLHARLGERQRFRDEQAAEQQAAESTAAAAAASATAAATAATTSRVREAAAAAPSAGAAADAAGAGGAAEVGLKRKRSRWDAGAGAGAGGSAEDGAGPTRRRRTEDARGRHGVAVGGAEEGGGGGWRQHADGDSDAEEEGSGSEGSAGDEEGGGGGRRRGREDEEEDAAIAGLMGHREPRVARGVASALTLFRELGALQQEERYSGRAKDANVDYDAPISDGLGSSIVLDYRDKDGNKMTTKQAYRELSYRFHGREPSQKSRDRRQRQEERRTAQLKAGSSDTPLGMAAALHRTQEALGQAHITLSRK